MKLEILRLGPELLEDYLHFFRDVAFTDHPEYPKCYCVHFHWNDRYESEFKRSGKHGADWAVEMVLSGIIQGYLAYVDGQVVGWCNANDRRGYDVLAARGELWDESDRNKRIKSVVCFLVAPDRRGKGVAAALLERACSDAAAEGYDCIEGYPLTGECSPYAAHHGTIPLFEKCGFTIHRAFEHDAVVRRYLPG